MSQGHDAKWHTQMHAAKGMHAVCALFLAMRMVNGLAMHIRSSSANQHFTWRERGFHMLLQAKIGWSHELDE